MSPLDAVRQAYITGHTTIEEFEADLEQLLWYDRPERMSHWSRSYLVRFTPTHGP